MGYTLEIANELKNINATLKETNKLIETLLKHELFKHGGSLGTIQDIIDHMGKVPIGHN